MYPFRLLFRPGVKYDEQHPMQFVRARAHPPFKGREEGKGEHNLLTPASR